MFKDLFWKGSVRYFAAVVVLLGTFFSLSMWIFLLSFFFMKTAESAEPIFISVPKKAFQCGVKTYLYGLIEVSYDTDQNSVADQFTLTRQYKNNPLFYARDANEDGRWEMVFRDIAEDGINGNEEEYLKFLPVEK